MNGVQLVYGLVSDISVIGFARVKLPTFDDIVTDQLPIIKARAMNDDENWPLEINEQVACLVALILTSSLMMQAYLADHQTLLLINLLANLLLPAL